jgi:hypothetical protein
VKKSEFIKRAWSFIDERRKWIRGEEKVGDTYCSVGALKAAYHQLMAEGMSAQEAAAAYRQARHELEAEIRGVSGRRSIMEYNDSREYIDVAKLWRRVIARLSKEETPVKVELKEQQPKVVRATANPQMAEKEKELA